ncbi:hypothetical protein POSPLADRAFT_1132328 [Postia placenta MAD-698-R-SB12]|uniref:Uncharacterized protein n=1 Tax=Postia placenta MAD-698-R-SB12 TaxID=670580 RepID=A0A1X6NDI4_9APHY|nr:hypothetical protein POSPLADRAFT_1132328 [Postia placenta MAD-698-R-SB12]OSX66691.1 hypothetical protein POSPLADRAFT_1132328 [Postia placenta MAD-698-R-SB12]
MSPNTPVVVVTGCSKGGIGFALCQEFAANGCKVYATARRVEAMEGFTHEAIEKLRLDVTDDGNIEEAIKSIIDREGRIDVLVNNAGAPCFGPLAEMPIERIKSTFDVNTFAILRLVNAVFPHMASRKRGTIVNIGSIVGEIPTAWGGTYSASKAAVRSISESLYMECAPFGINVVHVSPGGIRSNISTNSRAEFRLSSDTLYTPFLDSMLRRMGMSQQNALSAEEFSRRVVRQVLSKRPPRYMTLGKASRIFVICSWLPRALVLWLMWNTLVGKRTIKTS